MKRGTTAAADSAHVGAEDDAILEVGAAQNPSNIQGTGRREPIEQSFA